MTVIGTCDTCGARRRCDGDAPHLPPHVMPDTDIPCPAPTEALALVGVAS